MLGVLAQIGLVPLPDSVGGDLRRRDPPRHFGVFGDPCAVAFGPELDAPVGKGTHVDPVAQALAFQDQVGVPLPDPAQLGDRLAIVQAPVLAAPGVDVEEPRREHEMRVRVAVALVVQHPVHDRAVARVGLPDVAAHQVDLGLPRERFRQRDRDLAGEPGVVRLPVLLGLDTLDVLPETLRKTRPGHPFRDVHRQQPGPRNPMAFH